MNILNTESHFNVKYYLERIGYIGESPPTLATLDKITEAHTKTIPFENLDVVLNKGIQLSNEAIFDKLVMKKRGGYCFEQNSLLSLALQQLGFKVKQLSARVRVRFNSREPEAPRTHMFLRVEIDGSSYLTDVGMGAASLTKSLQLIPDIEQETPHDIRKLVQENGRWYQQIRYGNNLQDANEFTLEEMPFIDQVIANWYTSTHPGSHFKSQVIAARALNKGQRISLQDSQFTRRERNGDSQKTQLQTPQELIDVLTNEFGLILNSEEQNNIVKIVYPS